MLCSIREVLNLGHSKRQMLTRDVEATRLRESPDTAPDGGDRHLPGHLQHLISVAQADLFRLQFRPFRGIHVIAATAAQGEKMIAESTETPRAPE